MWRWRRPYRMEVHLAELKGDREFVLVVVAQSSLALMYVSVELQGDREVVLAAVARYGLALLDASMELQRDRRLC